MLATVGERRPELVGHGHYIAANASVIGSVRLHTGVSIWFNAVLRGDNDWIDIGEYSNVQDGAVLHTDPGIVLEVGARVTIGHLAMLHGCRVGAGSLIGIGAILLNRARIGANSVVGAGALVTEDREYPDGSLIVGAPARVARELEPGEIEELRRSADVYVRNAARYRDSLRPLSADD